MPNNVTAKTAWARKYIRPAVAVVLALVLLVGVLAWHRQDVRWLNVHGRRIRLAVATTPSAQAKGLGGRASLPSDQGMLFVFSQAATQCFWMKDMRFSIDILWLDGGQRVRFVQADVSPRTYPKAFCPAVPARFVVELPAGQAARDGIRTGQRLSF